MTTTNGSVVAIYKSHLEAECAVRELQTPGFDMKKISVIGRDFHADASALGYYGSGAQMQNWGKGGSFWGVLLGPLFGSAFFLVPGIGPLLLAGPIVSWSMGALETAPVLGGLSALGAGLCSFGIPRDGIAQYESALIAGKFVVIAHGNLLDLAQARMSIKHTSPESVIKHKPRPCCGSLMLSAC